MCHRTKNLVKYSVCIRVVKVFADIKSRTVQALKIGRQSCIFHAMDGSNFQVVHATDGNNQRHAQGLPDERFVESGG